MSPHPAISYLPPASPVTRRFHFVLCASRVIDYLSAVSQYNDIRCCSLCCTVRSEDEASLHFLLARQTYYYLALVFPLSTFNYPPSHFPSRAARAGPGPRCAISPPHSCVLRNNKIIRRVFFFLWPILGETIQIIL